MVYVSDETCALDWLSSVDRCGYRDPLVTVADLGGVSCASSSVPFVDFFSSAAAGFIVYFIR